MLIKIIVIVKYCYLLLFLLFYCTIVYCFCFRYSGLLAGLVSPEAGRKTAEGVRGPQGPRRPVCDGPGALQSARSGQSVADIRRPPDRRPSHCFSSSGLNY